MNPLPLPAEGPLPELDMMTMMQLRRFAQCMQIEKLDIQNEFDICREKYEEDVEKLVEKIRSQEVLLASVRTSAANSAREVERITAENRSLTDRAQVLEAEVKSVNAANEEMAIEIKTVHDLQSRVEHLTGRCQELEDECDSLRTSRHSEAERSRPAADRTVVAGSPTPPTTAEVKERPEKVSVGGTMASPGEIEELVGLLEKSTSEVERLQDQVALWRRRGEEAEKEVEKLKSALEEHHYIEDEQSQPSFTASTTPESTGIFVNSSEEVANASSSLRGSMDSHTAERAENELLHFLLEGAASSQEIESIREEFLTAGPTDGAGRRKWPSSMMTEVGRLRSTVEAVEANRKVLQGRVKELEEELSVERKGTAELEARLEALSSSDAEAGKPTLQTQINSGVATVVVAGKPVLADIGTSPLRQSKEEEGRSWAEGCSQTTPRESFHRCPSEKEGDGDDDNTVCSAEDLASLKREIRRLKQEAVESAKCATNKLRSARDQLSSREVDLARAQRAGEMAEKRIEKMENELREVTEKLREEAAISERLETKLKLMVAQLSLARSETSGLRDEVVRRRKMMEKMDEKESKNAAELEGRSMALADTEGLLLKMEEQTANLAEDTERFLEEYSRVCLNEERERMLSSDLSGHLIRAEERRRVAGGDAVMEEGMGRERSAMVGEDRESIYRREYGRLRSTAGDDRWLAEEQLRTIKAREAELRDLRLELRRCREELAQQQQQEDVVVFEGQSRLSSIGESTDFGSEQMAALTEYVDRLSAEYSRVCLNEEREKMLSSDLSGHLIRAEERGRGLQRAARDVAAKTDAVMMKEGKGRERREMTREDREGHLEALVEALVDLQAAREIGTAAGSSKKFLTVGVQTIRVARWNSMVQASPRSTDTGVQTRVEVSTAESQTNPVGKKGRSVSRLTQTNFGDDHPITVHPVDADHEAAIREEAIREMKAHMEEQVRITRCNGQVRASIADPLKLHATLKVRLRAREESYRAEVERLGREHQRVTAELERRHAEDLRVQRLRLERQWQVRRSMAEMPKRKEDPPKGGRRAAVPQPIRIDDEMFRTPREEVSIKDGLYK
ncbi:hypothetical protein FOZ63_027862 [Perkinsus olseni]|uniref:Uncharacterized protein n=1 Tax=Perkinsus olseni TaxID=32597 RepID=A0A7J6QMY2_PEROL|nr:hypothetical protein FOZ63_027862 [Perkinsus olseni]